mmetsp:Transcript_24050/g.47784  ORF Transcript_24050/g.47784 Transcript_24050/m.47784 type:complete len:132 (-) Transcript_24050:711-1106(-)
MIPRLKIRRITKLSCSTGKRTVHTHPTILVTQRRMKSQLQLMRRVVLYQPLLWIFARRRMRRQKKKADAKAAAAKAREAARSAQEALKKKEKSKKKKEKDRNRRSERKKKAKAAARAPPTLLQKAGTGFGG